MNSGMTLVNKVTQGAAAGVTGAKVITLGLSMNEAARIVGVGIAMYHLLGASGVAVQSEVAISFDPEDTAIVSDDDEQFVHCYNTNEWTTTGGSRTAMNIFYDFHAVNLITTRNLALLVASVGGVATAEVCVYYEKFAPNKDTLVQLISTRR